MSVSEQYRKLRKKLEEESDIAPVISNVVDKISSIDLAPTRTSNNAGNKWYNGWLQKGALEDGLSVKNFAKNYLGTGVDISEDLGVGILGMVEKTADAFATLSPYLQQAQFMENGGYYNLELQKRHDEAVAAQKKDIAKFVSKDIIDEKKIAKKIIGGATGGFDYEASSYLGEKTDAVVESGGQLLGTLGLTAVGVPWWLSTGATAFGGEAENALNQGATYDEAAVSATIAAGAEVLMEKLSGAIKFGGKTWDDALIEKIARGVSDEYMKTALKTGVDMAGEGLEEWFTEDLNKFGQWLTYRDEEELKELLFSKEALLEKLEAFIGGAALGGVSSVGQTVRAKDSDIDPVSERTVDEEKVVRKVYEDLVAEAQKDGKVTAKEKTKIYDSVVEKLEKGGISTDTIEKLLDEEGYKAYEAEKENFFKGDTMKYYKDVLASEEYELDRLRKELSELSDDPDSADSPLYDSVLSQIAEIEQQPGSNVVRQQLDQEVKRINEMKNQLRTKVRDMVKGTKLEESYNELIRSNQKFTADVEQYTNEHAKKTIQNIMDSELADNTNEFHENADWLAKLSEGRGLTFTLTDNAKLKESGHYVEGAKVNGFINENGDITLNIDSNEGVKTAAGHEVSHTVEGSKHYDAYQDHLFKFAIEKEGLENFNKRLDAYKELYKDRKNTTAEKELTAQLMGEYGFTDQDFVDRLLVNDKNLFQKVWDEIKYMYRLATSGSKAQRELEKAMHMYEKAWNEGKNATDTVKYSLENGNKSKYNKKSKTTYSQARTLLLDFENGSAPAGQLRTIYFNGKPRFFEKTDSGAVELSITQYNERNGFDAENFDRRANLETGKASDIDGSTQRGSLVYADNYRNTRDPATVFEKAFYEELSDVSRRSEGDLSGYNDGDNVTQTEYNEEASDDSDASSVTFSNDYATIRNFMKEEDTGTKDNPDIRDSLSKESDSNRYINGDAPLNKFKYDPKQDFAPTIPTANRKPASINRQDNSNGVIPVDSVVNVSDRNNYGTVESYNPETDTYLVNFKSKRGYTATIEFDAEQLTHVFTAREQFNSQPDIDQVEYENAEAVRVATENRLAELAEEDLTDPEKAAEYQTVLEAWIESKTILTELDAKFAERANSITDADAPPEKVFNAPAENTFDAPTELNSSVAKVLSKPSKKKNSGGVLHAFANKFVDKGSAVETLTLNTGNMELQAKWNSALPSNTDARAQYFMQKGSDNVPALKTILDEQKKAGKTDLFNEYMYHLRNIDSMTLQERMNLPNKPVFGNSVTADISRKKVAEFEKANPEFSRWAKQYYDISNYLLDELVREGLVTQESADYLRNKYPHYIPLKRAGKDSKQSDTIVDSKKASVGNTIKTATGGNTDIEPLGNAMAERIQQHYHAIAKNRFGVELKNTLNSVVSESKNLVKADDMLEAFEGYDDGLLKPGRINGMPTFTVYEDGNRVEFEITDELYHALEPSGKGSSAKIPVLYQASEMRRKLLTTWDPVFSLYRNPVKDLQDVMINSQHPLKTYANIPAAMIQLFTDGGFANEYHKNGGMSNTYYDNQKSRFVPEDNFFKKVIGLPFRAIENAGEFIEQVPRLAEYMASRKDGRSIDRSMLDAARVTTNFAAGGDYTKFLNRNFAPFLNASVQGAAQHVRNFRESAKIDGFKGVVKTLSKYVIAGVPALIFNSLVWDDDEEYEELNEYVKDNYYVVAKTKDGKFIRIPKGRTAAVIQEGLEQMQHLITGDDEADFNTFFDLFLENIAPNNFLTDNIFAPLVQTVSNNAWYSEDIVPERLQGLPAEEQFDESTDSLSKWLGEKLPISPMKINYLLDQYSGGIGNVVLPMMTPEVESGDDSFIGNMIAPWKKELTTDSVLNNKNPGEFFELSDKIQSAASGKNATEAEQLQSKYIQSIGYEISEMYAQKRDIQISDLPADKKYQQIRELQEKINELAKNAIDRYENVSINGMYSEVGDKRYNYDKKNNKWYEIDSSNGNWYSQKEQEVTKGLGISPAEYWNNRDEYNFKYDNPEKYEFLKEQNISVAQFNSFDEKTKSAYNWAYNNQDAFILSKAVSNDVVTYRKYVSDLYALKADKDKYGNTISGTKKAKVIDYINNMDADFGSKVILYKSMYPPDDTYNRQIIDYLNSRNDLYYEDMEIILKQLGFKVDSNGNISW